MKSAQAVSPLSCAGDRLDILKGRAAAAAPALRAELPTKSESIRSILNLIQTLEYKPGTGFERAGRGGCTRAARRAAGATQHMQ